MNLLQVHTDLSAANINPRIFSIDYDKKEIKLSIDSADSQKLFDANEILEKHSAQLKSIGFRLVTSYAIG